MAYNEVNAECRLEYRDLKVIHSPEGGIPPGYVTVEFTSPCGRYATKFALHRFFLYCLMGRTGRMVTGPGAFRYLRLISALQAEGILATKKRATEGEDQDEESPDR